MTPLPGELGSNSDREGVVAWRLDLARFADSWDSGQGAFLYGGRWNSPGMRAVYCAIDPAAAILEVAVHKTFRVLDTVAHVLTSMRIPEPRAIHVVRPIDVPDPAWLRPGLPSRSQQAFGDALLEEHGFLLLPSVVSPHSWNLVFDATAAKGRYELELQESFMLDPRLHSAAS